MDGLGLGGSYLFYKNIDSMKSVMFTYSILFFDTLQIFLYKKPV